MCDDVRQSFNFTKLNVKNVRMLHGYSQSSVKTEIIIFVIVKNTLVIGYFFNYSLKIGLENEAIKSRKKIDVT
jgi:hypothetical protein